MKPSGGVTDSKKGPLRPDEADRLVAEYRRRVGIPVNTWPAQKPLEHPPVPPAYEIVGQEPKGICPLCGFAFGAGVFRVDLPMGHPQFGRLVACQACRGGN